jgi:hypothetical protein
MMVGSGRKIEEILQTYFQMINIFNRPCDLPCWGCEWLWGKRHTYCNIMINIQTIAGVWMKNSSYHDQANAGASHLERIEHP